MSAREWKPGDVAVITQRHDPIDRRGGSWRASKDDKGWASLDPSIGWLPDGDVAEARPLLVIDPEDREQVERLRDLYDREVVTQNGDPDPRDVTPAARGNALQAALRSLLAPPKPPEPQGLGAVVRDVEDSLWVHSCTGGTAQWMRRNAPSAWREYTEIDAVEVLSEGVQP